MATMRHSGSGGSKGFARGRDEVINPGNRTKRPKQLGLAKNKRGYKKTVKM